MYYKHKLFSFEDIPIGKSFIEIENVNTQVVSSFEILAFTLTILSE